MLRKHFMVISQADPLAAAPACETMQRLLYNAPILTPITSNVTCLRCKATNAFQRVVEAELALEALTEST